MKPLKDTERHSTNFNIIRALVFGAAVAQSSPSFAQDWDLFHNTERPIDPSAIEAPTGLRIEAFAKGLSYVTDVTFSEAGEMYAAEAGGHTYGTEPEKAPPPRILRVHPDGSTTVIYEQAVPLEEIRAHTSSAEMPEGLISPVTGVTWHEGFLYVTHRSRVSRLDPASGAFTTVINGLPSWGFFHNNKAVFGPDGRMYFCLSTQGNAGPIDAHWMKVIQIFNKPEAHEIPGEDVTLTGKNFATPVEDPETPDVDDKELTGVYVPLGTTNAPGDVISGQTICNGAFFRANPDGSNLERIAWGFRSNFGYRFSPEGRLITTQNSGNPIPPRPLHSDTEPIYEVVEGEWYGWPDFYSSVPITDPRFELKGADRGFVLTEETHQRLLGRQSQPRAPLAVLEPHTSAEGMVFGRSEFGLAASEILVAEFGTVVLHLRDELPGFRVQAVDLATGAVRDFLKNQSGKPASATEGGGLERPIQLEWGPDGSLYLVDFGEIELKPTGMEAHPNTGVIWRITAEGPVLGVQFLGNEVRLSWPEADGFLLEQTDDLGRAAWMPVAGQGEASAVLPVSERAMFFRLHQLQ